MSAEPLSPIPPDFPRSFDWIFFDLDGTLWDHVTASAIAVQTIAQGFGVTGDELVPLYKSITRDLVREIEEGAMTIEESRPIRFERILRALERNPADYDTHALAVRYLEVYLGQQAAFEGAAQLLARAAGRAKIAVLTNATHETQDPKIAQLESDHLIDFVVTTDEASCLKPDPRFYEYAEQRAGNPAPERILMVGDSWANDIAAPHARGYWCAWISDTPIAPEPLARLVVVPSVVDLEPLFT